MKLEGTPQELIEFLMAIVGQSAADDCCISIQTVTDSTRPTSEEMTRSER